MENEYVEVVKRWLADNDSVSLEELKANYDAVSDDCHEMPDTPDTPTCAWHAASDAYTAAEVHTTIYPWSDPDAAYARYAAAAAMWVRLSEGE
jgi:hypothetical protein